MTTVNTTTYGKAFLVVSPFAAAVDIRCVPPGRFTRASAKNTGFFPAIIRASGLKTLAEGVNIKYADLLEVVRQDLNSLIKLSDKETVSW